MFVRTCVRVRYCVMWWDEGEGEGEMEDEEEYKMVGKREGERERGTDNVKEMKK